MSFKPRPPRGVLAWHFIGPKRELGYGDGRIVFPGKTYSTPDRLREIELCSYGMHASVRALDALEYVSGSGLIACRVAISGETQHGCDKIVGRHRRVLWMSEADDCLRTFARRCALDVLHLWDAPEVVRQYLGTGDEGIRDAAWAAARAAAWAAARAAARDAAWAAAWAAQRNQLDSMLLSLRGTSAEVAR